MKLILALLISLILTGQTQAKETPTQEELSRVSEFIEANQNFSGQSFKHFTLPNGLEVLAIHDPTTNNTSLALNVRAGFTSDPVEAPGLAHYLEHALFLGSAKYPEPMGLRKYILENNGAANAFTELENTHYHFTIIPEYLDGALDRLVDALTQPLLLQKDEQYRKRLENELSALESEYQINRQNISFQFFHLGNILAKQDHPQHRVFQGNKESLQNASQDLLISFFNRFYQAGLMKLVISGPQSLDELEKKITAQFSAIPNSNTEKAQINSDVYPEGDQPHLIQIRTSHQEKILSLRFPSTPLSENIYSNPHLLISRLISYSGENSLLSILQERGWIHSFHVNPNDYTSYSSFLDFNFNLTDEGVIHYQEIISEFFAWIHLLKKDLLNNPSKLEKYFRTQQKFLEVSYRYATLANDSETLSNRAKNLYHFEPNDILYTTNLLTRFDIAAIQKLYHQIQPKNVQVTLAHHNAKSTRQDSRYDLNYSIEAVNPQWIETWEHPQINSKYHLPAIQARFTPKNYDLVGTEDPLPRAIKTSTSADIWIKTDHQFKIPKAIIQYVISTPVLATTKQKVLQYFYQEILNQKFRRDLQLANEPSAAIEISSSQSGIRFNLMLGAYSDNLIDLARASFGYLKNMDISDEDFRTTKSKIIEIYKSTSRVSTSSYAGIIFNTVIDRSAESIEEKINAVEGITLEEILQYSRSILKQASVSGLGFGNITESMLQTITEELYGAIHPQPLSVKIPRFKTDVHLPEGPGSRYIERFPGEDNAWLTYFDFGAVTLEKTASLEIAAKLLSHYFFEDMRGQRKLGYDVFLSPLVSPYKLGLKFSIQTSRSLIETEMATSQWFQSVLEHGDQLLTEEAFNSARDAAIRSRLTPPSDFADKFYYYLSLFFELNKNWNYQKEYAHVLKNLKREDVIRLIKDHMTPLKQRRLSVSIIGESSKYQDLPEIEGETLIEDIHKFKLQKD